VGIDPVTLGIGAIVLGAAGGGYGVYSGERARHDAKRQAKEQEDRANAIAAERDANIAKLREQYGIGGSETAQANSKTLADTIENYYKGLLQSNMSGVENQFANVSRTSRQNLARIGQLGGGLDSAAKSSTLAGFLRARQEALSNAENSRNQFKSNLDSQRLNFEGQISGGTMANPDWGAIQAQKENTLKQAQGQIAPMAVGNLFNTAANTYFNGRMQEAQGNQGLQAFNFNSKNSGRIS